jgi:hypothetical protein
LGKENTSRSTVLGKLAQKNYRRPNEQKRQQRQEDLLKGYSHLW